MGIQNLARAVQLAKVFKFDQFKVYTRAYYHFNHIGDIKLTTMLRNILLVGRNCLKLPRVPIAPAQELCHAFNGLSINHNNNNLVANQDQPFRGFHSANSKVHHMDFRYRMGTGHIRTHLLIIRRQKMKKHQRRKWRRKFKCVIAKERFKREIAKEKTFRVELLTIIKRAEQFDPKEYALRKIREANDKPVEISKEERLEQLKELIRKHRYQTHYVKPKHRRAEI